MFGRTAALTALLLTAALFTGALPVAAHERGLSIETEDHNRVEISSETEVSGDEVDFRYRVEAEGRPKLAIQVEKETGNDTLETETEVEFSAAFREVFEFEDDDGDGVQDTDEDVLSTIRLDDLTYEPLQVAPHVADGEEGFRVTLRGSEGNFSFGLVSYLFPQDAVLNGTPVPEEAVKVDILLSGYPFVSDTSSLGLEIGAESTVEQEIEGQGEDSEEITVSVERGTAFFQWASEALVDGESAAVTASWRANQERLFLYYPHGDVVVHDPLLGFRVGATVPSPLNATTFVVVAGVGVALLLVALLVWRRRS